MEILRTEPWPTVEFTDKLHRSLRAGSIACGLWLVFVKPLLDLPGEPLQAAASIASPFGNRFEQFAGALQAHGTQVRQQARHGTIAAMPGEGARVSGQHIHIAHHAGGFAHRPDCLQQALLLLLAAGHQRGGNCFNAACVGAQIVNLCHWRVTGEALQRSAQYANRSLDVAGIQLHNSLE